MYQIGGALSKSHWQHQHYQHFPSIRPKYQDRRCRRKKGRDLERGSKSMILQCSTRNSFDISQDKHQHGYRKNPRHAEWDVCSDASVINKTHFTDKWDRLTLFKDFPVYTCNCPSHSSKYHPIHSDSIPPVQVCNPSHSWTPCLPFMNIIPPIHEHHASLSWKSYLPFMNTMPPIHDDHHASYSWWTPCPIQTPSLPLMDIIPLIHNIGKMATVNRLFCNYTRVWQEKRRWGCCCCCCCCCFRGVGGGSQGGSN